MAIAILIIVSVIITRAGIFFAVSAIVSVATIPFPFAFPSPSPSLSPYPTIPFPPTIQIKLQHHCATSSPSLQSHHIASLPSLLPTFVRSGVSRSRVCQLSDRRQVGGGRWVASSGWWGEMPRPPRRQRPPTNANAVHFYLLNYPNILTPASIFICFVISFAFWGEGDGAPLRFYCLISLKCVYFHS